MNAAVPKVERTPESISSSYSESLLVHFRRVESLKSESSEFHSVDLNKRQLCDLELLLNRAFYPLEGYLSRSDYESVLDTMRLQDGTLWPIPVCMDVTEAFAQKLERGGPLAIRDEEGCMLAVMQVEDIWQCDKRREALAVYGTDDPEKHPGVRRLLEDVRPWYIGGKLEGIQLPHHYDFPELRLTPSDMTRLFIQRGWRNVIGFETAKHLHCAHHEMIRHASREAGASILVQPAVGSRTDDMDYFSLLRCYQAFAGRFPKNMIQLGLIPMAPRQAGPREALWKAIIKRNFGCTHFIVADDLGDPFVDEGSGERFYPRGAAQKLVHEHENEIGIKMVPMKRMVYVEDKAQYVPESEVQPGMVVKRISSTELKRRLETGAEIPEWFSFPEIVAELRKAYPSRHQQGLTVFFTGLSGAGKSTLAKILLVRFLEMNNRPVSLLDGDIVRKNLSSELTFSKEHRNLNIQRIGFVASEITKNGGIAICAPIAPYEESRRKAREMVSRYGGFIEVHVSTPLEVCEQRDRKGIYAKARMGIMKGVTGIDDPYETPACPEIRIDTSELTPTEAVQNIMLFLEEQGYVR
jgi:sulfate adenylyltransferase